MAWFRTGSRTEKLAIMRSLSQAVSYATRTPVLSPPNRHLRTTLFRSEARAAPVPHPVPLSRLTDSFLDGPSTVYLEELQRAWEEDPNSVDESWDNFIRNFVGQSATSPGISGQTIQESMRLMLLVRAYQVSGHMKAKLDPLGLKQRKIPEDLNPALYGFTEADLDREFFLGTLRAILTRLEQACCGTIGCEFMHIADCDKCNWLRDKIETPTPKQYSQDHQQVMLDQLMWSTQFENFLATKWTAAKRFGLEGGETLIPGMKEMSDWAADLGVEGIVIGMSHIGSGGTKPVDEVGLYTGTGDVKYHLGTSYDRPTRGGKRIHLSLVANHSHLEAVDPLVIGKRRAKQYYADDVDRIRNMGVLIHGDGSLAGQGVVFETFHLSALPNYATVGTVHVVINNQVAFTMDPRSSRSSQYCTDVAKALNAPIFHVNGDDLEAVVNACELVAEWQQTFHSDVVVDILCYCRFGHNEIDELSFTHFTQPKTYQVIRNQPSALEIYQMKLLEAGQLAQEDIDAMHKNVNTILTEEFLASKDYVPRRRDWLSPYWSRFKSPEKLSCVRNTGVKPGILKTVGKAITTLPDNFKPHRAVKKIYGEQAQVIETGEGIDWALGEALAFATLLVEGNHVRSSGQDVERGMFSHRHAVLHDQEMGKQYCPLDHVVINQNPEMFTVSNSSLSLYGVLGLEMGYSMENPNALVMWEAQFGDFSNGAQVMFDQFSSSGKAKWLRQTGLVALLPHGYDGQGPEHSSAQLERFLQKLIAKLILVHINGTMSDENPYVILEMEPTKGKQIQECNLQIVNVTTPANDFHVLQCQVHWEFCKPLIVMSSKNLLRHKECKSNLLEFDDVQGQPGFDKQGTKFKRLIMDQNFHSDFEEGIRRLILCSREIDEQRRIESKDIVTYAEIVWCEEEPVNVDAFHYIAPRLWTAMRALGRGDMDGIKYVGRAPAAATATGFYQVHVKEQTELVQRAFQAEPINYLH
ncbi:Oxoglutarate dehydrogenase (succinyl-transferring) [Bertholletia excelsa]